ncbi:hypothetical protein AB0J84_17560 [Micromonospora arborensis]|uniref:hypothetical protein n=1 Tax=Micromonospora arborensis TaxID=2116518 RepID=UPI003426F6CF
MARPSGRRCGTVPRTQTQRYAKKACGGWRDGGTPGRFPWYAGCSRRTRSTRSPSGPQVAVCGERCDLGLYLDVTDGAGRSGHWFVDGLLGRAGDDPERAADLAIADVTAI